MRQFLGFKLLTETNLFRLDAVSIDHTDFFLAFLICHEH